MVRRKDDSDETGEKYFTLCQLVEVASFNKLRTNKIAVDQ